MVQLEETLDGTPRWFTEARIILLVSDHDGDGPCLHAEDMAQLDALFLRAREQTEAQADVISDLLAACENALACIEAMADRIDERCAEDGCLCTMPGKTPCSQTYRTGEIAMLRIAIAKARGEATDAD